MCFPPFYEILKPQLLSLPPANEVWGKVIFLHLSVILFTGGSTWKGTPPGRYTPRQVRPQQVHPPGSYTPGQVHLLPGQVHPLPGQVHPLSGQVYPPGQVPPPLAGMPFPSNACWQGSHSDWKTGKIGRHFPVREKSGNFEDWKSQGKSNKILENWDKLR